MPTRCTGEVSSSIQRQTEHAVTARCFAISSVSTECSSVLITCIVPAWLPSKPDETVGNYVIDGDRINNGYVRTVAAVGANERDHEALESPFLGAAQQGDHIEMSDEVCARP